MTEQLISAFPSVSICIEVVHSPIFGINDFADGDKIQILPLVPGMLTVENPNNEPVYALAIDKCMFQDGEQPGMGRCDGAVWDQSRICWFEIKNSNTVSQFKNHRKKAYKQLFDTIDLFNSVLPASAKKDALISFPPQEDRYVKPAGRSQNQVEADRFYQAFGVILLEGNVYSFSAPSETP